MKTPKVFVILGGLLAFLVVVHFVTASNPSAPIAAGASSSGESEASENPERQANYAPIPIDMAVIYNSLRDHDGVRWGQLVGTRNGTTLCGSLNSHNVFGGYTGQRRFILNRGVKGAGAGSDHAVLYWQEHDGFPAQWKAQCERDPNAYAVDGQQLAGTATALTPFAR